MKVKGNGQKKHNPYAKALTQKCFTSRMVSAKVRYVRNPKHKGKEFGNSAIQIAALVPMAIPSSLDLIGFELPLVGEIRVPAPGMIPRRSHPDMLGNDRGRGPSLQIDAKDLSVAAPEFLYHLSDFYCRSAGGGADQGLESWVEITGHEWWRWVRMGMEERGSSRKIGRPLMRRRKKLSYLAFDSWRSA